MEYDTLAKIDLALRNCDLYIQVCYLYVASGMLNLTAVPSVKYMYTPGYESQHAVLTNFVTIAKLRLIITWH